MHSVRCIEVMCFSRTFPPLGIPAGAVGSDWPPPVTSKALAGVRARPLPMNSTLRGLKLSSQQFTVNIQEGYIHDFSSDPACFNRIFPGSRFGSQGEHGVQKLCGDAVSAIPGGLRDPCYLFLRRLSLGANTNTVRHEKLYFAVT
jgi:hypothetical protein